jgi:hypothetical protein
MEIAGGFVGNLSNVSVFCVQNFRVLSRVQMLRCGNRFRRAAYKEVFPLPQDEGTILDMKWRQWIENQSFIRYVSPCPLINLPIYGCPSAPVNPRNMR